MSFKVFIFIIGAFASLSLGHPTIEMDGSRIVGGAVASDNRNPSMVSLIMEVFYPVIMTVQVCGASLVSRRHALTAAHCIHAGTNWQHQFIQGFRGMIGSNKWDSGTVILFTNFVAHPRYNHFNVKNDIGVLMMNPVTLNDRVAIMPISYDFYRGDDECFVTGFGQIGAEASIAEALKVLYVNTISSAECTAGVRHAASQIGWSPPHDPQIEICTFHSPGQGVCHGDSGSALVLRDTGRQIGIVSWGFPCAIGAPDMFVRISGYTDWLKPLIDH